jgi:hypothetical protein
MTARTIDLRRTSRATLKAATRSELDVGDFCRTALAALGPLLDASVRPTVRLEVDGVRHQTTAYARAKIRDRIADARGSLWLYLQSSDGVTVRLAETVRYAYVAVDVEVPVRSRDAVVATGRLLAEALYTLATGVDLVEGHVHHEAEWQAYCLQHGVIDGYENLVDLAWRHVVPASLGVAPDHVPDCVRTLPNGSLWVALPGAFDEPPAASARALRAAVFRALFPARDAGAFARDLAARADWLAPVDVRWDEDLEEILATWVAEAGFPYGHVYAREWSDRTPEVTAWTLTTQLGNEPVITCDELPAVLEPYGAEALALMHEDSIAGLWPPRSAALPDIDRAAVLGRLSRFGRLVMFASDVERHLVPALATYLGEVLVHELGGRWLVPADLPHPPNDDGSVVRWPIVHLPFEEQCRIGVIVGSVVVYPFEQARQLIDKQGGTNALALEASFTKLFRWARRSREKPPSSVAAGGRRAKPPVLPRTMEPRAIATSPDGLVAVATYDAIHVFRAADPAGGNFRADASTFIATCWTSRPHRLTFAGTDVLASAGGGLLSLWDPRTGALIETHPTGGNRAVTQLVAVGAEVIAFGTESGRIGVMTGSPGRLTLLRATGRPIGALALSATGEELFVALRSTIVRFDVRRGLETARFVVGRVTALAYAGAELGFATEAGQVGVVDVSAGGTTKEIGRVDTIARRMFRGRCGWVVVTDDAATVFESKHPVRVELPPGPRRWRRSIDAIGDSVLLVNTATGMAVVELPAPDVPSR